MKNCPRCDFVNDDSAKFCKQCGEKLDILQKENINTCPHCGKKLPKDAMFCKHCGTQVKQMQKQQINQKKEFASLKKQTFTDVNNARNTRTSTSSTQHQSAISQPKGIPNIHSLVLGLCLATVVIAFVAFIALSSTDSGENATSDNSRQNYATKNDSYGEEYNDNTYDTYNNYNAFSSNDATEDSGDETPVENDGDTVSEQKSPEFEVYSGVKEDYANALQPENYQYYDSRITDFSFYYPDNLYCNVKTVEDEECEYGFLIKKIVFSGSNGSKLIYQLIQRTNSLSLEAETDYIYNKEVANLYEEEDIIFSTNDNYGKVIVTGWDSADKNYAIYDLCKIEKDYILQMKVIFPSYTSDLDKAQKGYVTECYYRLCGFSDTTLAVRSYDEYINEN